MTETAIRERNTARVSALLPADVRIGEDEHSAVCVDLSPGGVGIRMDSVPSEGDDVALRVHMPGGQIIAARAEVMHSGVAEIDRCGLRFVRLSQGALSAIHNFVAHRNRTVLPLPSDPTSTNN